MDAPSKLHPDTEDVIRRSAKRHNRRFLVMSVIASVAIGVSVALAALLTAVLNTGI